MGKLPYRVDGPTAEIDAVINNSQRRKINDVDLFRKPHLTWHEYQACLTLDDDDRLMFLAIKRENGSAKIIHLPPDLIAGRKRNFVVRTDIDLRPVVFNSSCFPAHEKPQRLSRLSR